MHPVVFSREWFEYHQAKLLWFLNHPFTRRPFRSLLRIRKHDIGYDNPICELRPDGYTVHLGGDEFAADFRTHHKYAKRLYYSLKPVWFILHFLDWFALDRFVPELSFGFSTLTIYPEPSGGTFSADAIVYRDGQDVAFATIRAGAGIGASNSSTLDVYLASSATANQFANLQRTIATFNTRSSIDPNYVSSATISLFGVSSKDTGLGSPDIHVAGASPSSFSSIANTDFSNISRTSFGSVASASWVLSAYNVFTLNSSGIANIDYGGSSAFSVQLSWDLTGTFAGVWSGNQASDFFFSGANQTGNSQDPKLVIVYSVAGRTSNNDYHPSWLGSLIRPAAFKPGRAR